MVKRSQGVIRVNKHQFNMLHIVLHFFVPALVAIIWYKKSVSKSWLVMIATMIVDADHLLTVPVYDPHRCSIGFHPLHSYVAIGLYIILLFIPRVRVVGVGLVIHMALDYVDCLI